MTEEEKKEFAEYAEKLARGITALQLEAQAATATILTATIARINQTLARQPSDYTQWRLSALQQSMKENLRSGYDEVNDSALDIQTKAWKHGADVVDKPLAMAGLGARMNAIDNNLLLAMQHFQTNLITNAGEDVVNRINVRLAGVVMGTETPFEAMKGINELLEGGKGMKRAQAIVITETGRAFSAATQQRLEEAVASGVAMKKKWQHSKKRHQRFNHALIDGVMIEVHEKFYLGSETALYPRAPGVSAKNSVNCGCVHFGVVADVEEN